MQFVQEKDFRGRDETKVGRSLQEKGELNTKKSFSGGDEADVKVSLSGES